MREAIEQRPDFQYGGEFLLNGRRREADMCVNMSPAMGGIPTACW